MEEETLKAAPLRCPHCDWVMLVDKVESPEAQEMLAKHVAELHPDKKKEGGAG